MTIVPVHDQRELGVEDRRVRVRMMSVETIGSSVYCEDALAAARSAAAWNAALTSSARGLARDLAVRSTTRAGGDRRADREAV